MNTSRISRIISTAIALAAVAAAITAGGCRSKKAAAFSPAPEAPAAVSEAPVKEIMIPRHEKAYAMAFSELAEGYSAWTDVAMPVSFELYRPKNFAVSGRATMIRGKAIHISFRMLFGMEVASLYADTDSVYIVAKFQKMYYAESLSRFTSALGLSIENIQDLILGRAFVPGAGTANADDSSMFTFAKSEIDSDVSGSLWSATPRKRINGVDWHYEFYTAPPREDDDGAASSLVALVAEPENREPVVIRYDEPVETPAGMAASRTSFATVLKGKPVQASISWKASEARWNTERGPISYSIPRSYTRVSTESLVKMLSGL